MLVEKPVGSQLVGGTTNVNAMLLIRATHVRHETALKQIITLVKHQNHQYKHLLPNNRLFCSDNCCSNWHYSTLLGHHWSYSL